MGTHPSGPYCKLPFLFKVLSIDKPLSIQAHPNKDLAARLHKNFPDIYKDDNHKPELACALTPFEALCGFRPLNEILALISDRGCELAELLGGSSYIESLKQSSQSTEASLADLFGKLMKLDDNEIETAVNRMISRIKEKETHDDFDELVLYTNKHFPGDIGVFCVFLLQHVKLQRGESIFLAASLPHCYLSGNIIECMACSDNVVRAGLTPKLKDSETLCSMLDYTQNPVSVMRGNSIDAYCRSYPVPIDEFLLYRIVIEDEVSEYNIPRPEMKSPSILLVIQGVANLSTSPTCSTEKLSEGTVVFIKPNQSVSLTQIETPFEAYYCTCKIEYNLD